MLCGEVMACSSIRGKPPRICNNKLAQSFSLEDCVTEFAFAGDPESQKGNFHKTSTPDLKPRLQKLKTHQQQRRC
jgi:hypothetical protein